MTYLFGPVNSRRLGRSLGLDLVPPKTCTYDCIYCELGPTPRRTLRRREYQGEAILREVEAYLAEGGPPPDFLTLAGSGEPLLNLGVGRILPRLRELTDLPVAVLTNGALLYLPEVREALAAATVVLPSLDAAREGTFRAINRPHPRLSLARVLAGLEAFRLSYPGQIWLEVMLLAGLNDGEADLTALRRALPQIAPDKVQLNTAVRPPVEDWARPLAPAELAVIASFLGEGVEVIAEFKGGIRRAPRPGEKTLLAMLSRRPMVAADVAAALGLPLTLVQARLQDLKQAGLVYTDLYQQKEFYRCLAREGDEAKALTHLNSQAK